nr:hypothetical protein [Gemmata massiliana]
MAAVVSVKGQYAKKHHFLGNLLSQLNRVWFHNPNYFCRNSDCGRPGGDVGQNDGVGADLDPVPEPNRANDFGPRTHKHVVTEHRALALFSSNRYLMLNLDSCAPAHISVNYDPEGVDQDKFGPKFGSAPDDAPAAHRIHPIEEHFERGELPAPRPLHQAVPDHCGRTVREQNLNNPLPSAGFITPLGFRAKVGEDELDRSDHGCGAISKRHEVILFEKYQRKGAAGTSLDPTTAGLATPVASR